MERLDKLLCGTGLFSRAEARTLVRAGRVTVDGVPVCRPEEKIPRSRAVRADGVLLDLAEHVYWMLHKPAGHVSASKDERWPAITRLLPEEVQKRGVFCAGRLDADVTGLLILTDDGEYAHRVTSPRASIPKTYEVCLDTPVCPEDVTALAEGIVRQDGARYRPAVLEYDEADPCIARITVTEGKYHEVKNLMAVRGHRVKAMRRMSIGSLQLDPALREGESRRMTREEAMLAICDNRP